MSNQAQKPKNKPDWVWHPICPIVFAEAFAQAGHGSARPLESFAC
jgi:hypothetical protein